MVIYARVCSSEQRKNLERQAERLVHYCTSRGYQVHQVVKEIGSGANDRRPKLLAVLKDPQASHIVVEHQDRLTCFGFGYLETLLASQHRTIEVVNLAENSTEDLLSDLTSILSSFCAKLYGPRRAKRKTEVLLAQITEEVAPNAAR